MYVIFIQKAFYYQNYNQYFISKSHKRPTQLSISDVEHNNKHLWMIQKTLVYEFNSF
jgi:hypothetical protein